MTMLSKLIDKGSIPKIPNAGSILTGICTISTTTSVLVLLKLYRKSLKVRRTRKSPKDPRNSGSTNKKRLNKKFFSQLAKILQILVPSWTAPEAGYMGLISSMLVIRSLCDLWTIYLGTLIESAIIAGERNRFMEHLRKFAMTMPLMSLTNGLLKYSTRQLEIRFRARLTHHLMQKYMYKLTFYKLNQTMRNVDQLITTDVEKFATSAASLYSQLSKPMLDILIYVYGITRSLGASVPSTMLGYLGVAAVIISALRRPMARLTATEQALEGEYRFGNTRIITNSEEISFYKGSQRELDWILKSFTNLYDHLDGFTGFKFVIEFFENFVAKYIATVVGYYAVGKPFLAQDNLNLTQEVVQERQESYYRSGRMLVNLSQAIGRLVLNAKDLSRLAGYTSRVHGLMESLDQLNLEEDERLNSDSNGTGQRKLIKGIKGNGIGRYIIQDHIIRFEEVPIITPNGDVLIKGLSLEVKPGMNVLVSGPNGCGKSSLFRILGELWPLYGGVLTKPATDQLFYVPQKPYMPYGTFRDQVIYPNSVADMRAKGISDEQLVKFLQLVDLDWMVFHNETNSATSGQDQSPKLVGNGSGQKDSKTDDVFEQVWQEQNNLEESKASEGVRTIGQRRSWDAVDNWMDVLSGGQKQRLAMARMFYHRPQFAILDECTSAVSVDVEGAIYRYCRSAGITLLTVTHRKSLWIHHDYVLHMDGRGDYSFQKIDHSADPQFGS